MVTNRTAPEAVGAVGGANQLNSTTSTPVKVAKTRAINSTAQAVRDAFFAGP